MPSVDAIGDFLQNSELNNKCTICLQDLLSHDEGQQKVLIILPCYHAFHRTCINELRESNCVSSDKCPNCRKEIPLDFLSGGNMENVPVEKETAANTWELAGVASFVAFNIIVFTFLKKILTR